MVRTIMMVMMMMMGMLGWFFWLGRWRQFGRSYSTGRPLHPMLITIVRPIMMTTTTTMKTRIRFFNSAYHWSVHWLARQFANYAFSAKQFKNFSCLTHHGTKHRLIAKLYFWRVIRSMQKLEMRKRGKKLERNPIWKKEEILVGAGGIHMEVDHQSSKALPKIQKVFSTREFDQLVFMTNAIHMFPFYEPFFQFSKFNTVRKSWWGRSTTHRH